MKLILVEIPILHGEMSVINVMPLNLTERVEVEEVVVEDMEVVVVVEEDEDLEAEVGEIVAVGVEDLEVAEVLEGVVTEEVVAQWDEVEAIDLDPINQYYTSATYIATDYQKNIFYSSSIYPKKFILVTASLFHKLS